MESTCTKERDEAEPSCVNAHPLLIPLVVQNVLPALDGKDLLNARRVCREWKILATEEYICRESVQKSMGVYGFQDHRFISGMDPSKRVPVVRWRVSCSLASCGSIALLKTLRVIAPSAVSLCLEIYNYDGRDDDDDYSITEDGEVAQLNELVSQLRDEDLRMSRLETLYFRCKFYMAYRPLPDTVLLVMKSIAKGSENLKSFGCNFEFKSASQFQVVKSLPKSLTKLRLDGWSSEMSPYKNLLDPGFKLVELFYNRRFTFLDVQNAHLKELHVDNLEELFRQSYPSFPFTMLNVKKLRTEATCNSTYEFLNPFPNVVELGLLMTGIISGTENRMTYLQNNLGVLAVHPKVRKLFIHLRGSVTPDTLPSFGLLSHCFPNVSHLSFFSSSEDISTKLTDVFTHFPNIVWLSLSFYDYYPSSSSPRNALEFTLTGYKTWPWFDSLLRFLFRTKEHGEVGLTNLKKLKCLEIRANSYQYSQIFTKLTVHRVFLAMESLKEICFVEEKEFPEVCKPFVAGFRAKGIDLYRMKRRAETCFPSSIVRESNWRLGFT